MLLFNFTLSSKATFYCTKNSSQFIQSTEWLYVNREKAAHRLFPFKKKNSVNRIRQRFWHHRHTGLLFSLVIIFLPKIFPPSCRTKSQKKRFEEELNERMIQAIDGINAQKWVLLNYHSSLISILLFENNDMFSRRSSHQTLSYLSWQSQVFWDSSFISPQASLIIAFVSSISSLKKFLTLPNPPQVNYW